MSAVSIIRRKDGHADRRYSSNWTHQYCQFECSSCGLPGVHPLTSGLCENCGEKSKSLLSYSINSRFARQQLIRTQQNLWKKQKKRCVGCGYRVPFHMVTVDHIIPKKLAVREDKRNRQLLCLYCNSRKRESDMIKLARMNNKMLGSITDKHPKVSEFCARMRAKKQGVYNWFHAVNAGILDCQLEEEKRNEKICRALQILWYSYQYGRRVYGHNAVIEDKISEIEGHLKKHVYNKEWTEINTTGHSTLYNPKSPFASYFDDERNAVKWDMHDRICRGPIDVSDQHKESILSPLGNSGYGIPVLHHSNGSYIQAWCCEIKSHDVVVAPNDIDYKMTLRNGKWRGIAISPGWLR